MKNQRLWMAAFLLSASFLSVRAQKVVIPHTKEYKVLKCDLHLHTVFSDGFVWPSVHIEDATAEGLDAIAITDHMEYRRRGSLATTSLDEAFEVAKKELKKHDLLLIKGVEITRALPGGNLNALFLNKIDALEPFWDKKNWSSNAGLKEALMEAKRQGAYVFWCHPWWPNADGKARWTDVNEAFFKEGLFKGIEIVNGGYHPLPFQWAVDKNLTIFGNTDAHNPVRLQPNQYRDITLVFAKSRTLDGIKEALFDGRTLVLSRDRIFGKELYAKPLVERCLHFSCAQIDKNRVEVIIKNHSTITFQLAKEKGSQAYALSNETVKVPSLGTAVITLTGTEFVRGVEYSIPVVVTNVFLTPEVHLKHHLKFVVK